MNKSFFIKRALDKAGEHFRSDRSGWSLLGYSLRWLFSRTKRKIATRLTGKVPERFCADAPDKVMMAVRLVGGLGDYVVFARLLRDLSVLSDSLRLHIFCSSVASGEWVFRCLPCVEGVYDDLFLAEVADQYDCVMHLNQLVTFDEEPLDLARLTRLARPLSQCLASWRRSRKQWELYRERQPTMNGAFAHHAVVLGHNRNSFMHSQLGLEPGSLLLNLPCDDSIARDLAGRFGSWLTINNGFDANIVISSQQATKCYPLERWQRVAAGLRERCPGVKLVQIGGKTSVPIAGVDLDLVNATTLSQAAGLLRGALLHVDIEGGLVHVAASLGTRSVVLFGPTSLGYFGYADNVNLTSGFCGNCWGVTERWMETCPRGYSTARCMDQLEPARVIDAVAAAVHAGQLRRAA